MTDIEPTSIRRTAALALAAALATAAVPAAAADLVVAVNELARSLDPGEQTGNVDVRVYYSIFDTLIRRDFAHPAEGGAAKLGPGLAESWSWTAPTSFEVKLRRGVTCHDGSPFDAEDVMATFSAERMWGPSSYYPDGRVYFNTLKAVEKVDDHTVRFVTKEHDAVLDQRLASYMSFIICDESWNAHRKPGVDPKIWMDAASKATRWKPVGTGPYKFAEYQKNDRIVLSAFDAYYGGKPAAGKVTFRAVPEVAARVAGLVAGDFDIAAEIPPDQWQGLGGYKDVVLSTVSLENSHILVFNMSDPVLSDKNLRQALSLSIDRKALIETLWGDKTFTPNGYQLPSFGPTYAKDRPGYVYDLERAKKLLAQSKYKGQEISYRIIPNYYLYNVEAAQVLQEMWRAIGINVRIDFVEGFKDVRKPGMQIHPWSNTYRIPDPTGSMLVLWGPDADIQITWKYFTPNEEFNRLSRTMYVSADPAERRVAYQKMLDIFEDLMPMTMLYNPVTGYGMKKTVNWLPYSQYYMDFRPSNFSFAAK